MMRVLVTGGTGFVGSHIVERLLQDGDTVLVAKRNTSRLRWLPVERIDFIDAPLEKPEALAEVLHKIDAVVHAAGLTKARDEKDFFRVNTGGTRKLLELCLKHSPTMKQFVFVSSQAASCPGCAEDEVREITPEKPLSSYGRSKLAAETVVKEFAGELPVTIVRPPTVYGPRDKNVYIFFRLINLGLLPFPGNPDRQFSAIYVKDLAKAISQLLRVEHRGGSMYFVTDGEVHTWREFGDAIAEALGKSPKKLRLPRWALWPAAAISELVAKLSGRAALLSFDKVRELSLNWVCDGSLIRREVGFQCEYDLKRGMEETSRWYREMGWL